MKRIFLSLGFVFTTLSVVVWVVLGNVGIEVLRWWAFIATVLFLFALPIAICVTWLVATQQAIGYRKGVEHSQKSVSALAKTLTPKRLQPTIKSVTAGAAQDLLLKPPTIGKGAAHSGKSTDL